MFSLANTALSVAVVLPAYNESQLLAATVESLPDFIDFIVIVDDCSTDETAMVAKSLTDPRVRLLRHVKNKGVGAAIVTGYIEVLDSAADIAVVMGADGQMLPGEIRTLLDPIARGQADYVKGNRLLCDRARTLMPFMRWIGTSILSAMTRHATGLHHIGDSQCGFTAISRKALLRLDLTKLYERYGYPNDLLSLAAIESLRVVDVPVTPIYGSERSDLHIRKVVFPITALLVRALLRRMFNSRSRRQTAEIHFEETS